MTSQMICLTKLCGAVAGASGILSRIDLDVYGGGLLRIPDLFDISVTTAGPGGAPSGTILASATCEILAASPWNSDEPTTFVPSNAVPLWAGTPYWLVVAPHDNLTRGGWSISEAGVRGLIGQAFVPNPSAGDWILDSSSFSIPAFRVTAVPEPSLIAVSVVALCSVAFQRGRKSE